MGVWDIEDFLNSLSICLPFQWCADKLCADVECRCGQEQIFGWRLLYPTTSTDFRLRRAGVLYYPSG